MWCITIWRNWAVYCWSTTTSEEVSAPTPAHQYLVLGLYMKAWEIIWSWQNCASWQGVFRNQQINLEKTGINSKNNFAVPSFVPSYSSTQSSEPTIHPNQITKMVAASSMCFSLFIIKTFMKLSKTVFCGHLHNHQASRLTCNQAVHSNQILRILNFVSYLNENKEQPSA